MKDKELFLGIELDFIENSGGPFSYSVEWERLLDNLERSIVADLTSKTGINFAVFYVPDRGDGTGIELKAQTQSEIASLAKMALEFWGDSNGGDLLINGLFSSKTEELAYEVESFFGTTDDDEPTLLLRIQMDDIRVMQLSRDSGFSVVEKFSPTTDDDDDFRDVILAHFGLAV